MALFWASGVQAQVGLNQADPSIIERSLPKPEGSPFNSDAATPAAPAIPSVALVRGTSRIASSIIVEGGTEVPRNVFSDAIVPFLGRDLSGDDLSALTTAVSEAARKAGYPFASARIEPQAMSDGILRVKLDAGSLAAVRVIGASSPYADLILTKALVTGHAVRRGDLERAVLLVGDIPGVRVVKSQYIRQDGFGILLVTIAQDRASLYVQVDNRGSKEVGPIRSTVLGSIRGVLRPGDELGLISAQTPFQPSEFFFVRGRYTTPVGNDGATVSVSGSFGRANPGAALKPLDVLGKSVDAAVQYSAPLFRSRRNSLWGSLEIRGLGTDQSLLGSALRRDRLTTVTAAVNGDTKVGPGTLRGEIALVGGLPLPGVTHQSDIRKSRSDGDARFATLGYELDWTARFRKSFSVVLASQAQIASRPLLASAEIGAGGPAFGRAYDYAERTGDNGILGSAELRFDLGRVIPKVVDRAQLYGALDGGYVTNLRGGAGGGALLSTAAGIRVGLGRMDAMLEVALPLNHDRFDTGNRQPRVSFRLSRVF